MNAAATYTKRAAELKPRAAVGFSERRRQALLKLQKQQKQKHKLGLRKLASAAFNEHESTSHNAGAADGRKDHSAQRRKRFSLLMQSPEWLVDLPSTWGGHVSDHLAASALACTTGSAVQLCQDDDDDDDDDDGGGWLVTMRPEGSACLVVSGGGRTTVRDKNGTTLFVCSTRLPGGGAVGETVLDSGTAAHSTFVSAESRGKQRPYCILDGIWEEDSRTLHLVDVAAWAGQEVQDFPAAFRLQWFASKWADDMILPISVQEGAPAITPCVQPSSTCVSIAPTNIKYSPKGFTQKGYIHMTVCSWSNLTAESLQHVYAASCQGAADGLLAMHAGAARHAGVSPFLLRWRDCDCSKWEVQEGGAFHVLLQVGAGGVLRTREGIPAVAAPGLDRKLQGKYASSRALVRVNISASSVDGLLQACDADAGVVAEQLTSAAQANGPHDGLLLQVEAILPAAQRHMHADPMSKLQYLSARQNGRGCSVQQLLSAAAATAEVEAAPETLTADLQLDMHPHAHNKPAARPPVAGEVGHTQPRQKMRPRNRRRRQQFSMASLAAALAQGDI